MVGFARMRQWFEQLLHTHDTPQRTAAAYALGVLLGFSPVLGLHTVLGLALAFILRMNRVAVVLGVYTNLPWLVPAYYTVATLAGAALLGVDIQPRTLEAAILTVSHAPWSVGEFGRLARTFEPIFWSFILGSTLGAVLLAGLAYRLSLAMIVAHRRRVAQRSAEMPDL